MGILLAAYHRMTVNFTDLDATAPTEVGNVQAYAEISTSGSLQVDSNLADGGDGSVTFQDASFDDSLDVIGRPLQLQANQVFRDTVDAVGGGAVLGSDTWGGMPADPEFFARNEVQSNVSVELDNVNDPGVVVQIVGQHIYGVQEA